MQWKNAAKFLNSIDNSELQLFCLKNKQIEIYLTNYGAALISFIVKDKFNRATDIVLGYDTIDNYINDDHYIGSTIGQCANRVENGQFELDNQQFQLSCNNEWHHLHGGNSAWSKQIWKVIAQNENLISFLLDTGNIKNEYLANVQAKITYTLINNELLIDYIATSDSTTIINLTNHSYFNLSGTNETIANHELQIFSDAFFPLKENRIPTTETIATKNTPFDFTIAQPINNALSSTDAQIVQAKGIDHFFIKYGSVNELNEIAILSNKTNGLKLTISTSKQGVQIYTANFLEKMKGKNSQLYDKHTAICFECQAVPNAINNSKYKDLVILQPNESYHHQDKFVVEIV